MNDTSTTPVRPPVTTQLPHEKNTPISNQDQSHLEKIQQSGNQDDPCFQLKGNMYTLTSLELYFYNYKYFNQQMSRLVKQAPNFFKQTPIIISLEKLPTSTDVDFIELTQLCQEYGLFPIAIRAGTEEQQLAALVAGLPKLPQTKPKVRNEAIINSTENAAGSTDNNKDHTTTHLDVADTETPLTLSNPSKIITRPIRSGQQVYAAGGDLIVLGPVSTGAEVLADGNIHIYSSLRGRALAGIKGNMSARIFCHCLEPELISIAGHYKISDDLQSGQWGKPVHAHLEESQLIIDILH